MDFHKLYEEIDLSRLDQFISVQQQETLHLDFKQVEQAGFTRNDRKNLAKCISGFANSSGGLIVWGIDARKDDECGVDCAREKVPLKSLSLFMSELSRYTGDAVDPIADGVVHKKIVEVDDSGFAVTLVPESLAGPHMAKLGEDRYYKRSGDSFYKMEHYDIEDMFGRRKKPKLEVTARLCGKSARTRIILGVINKGRGSARAPYFAFDSPGPFSRCRYGYDGNGSEGLQRISRGQNQLMNCYGASADFVVHPGTSIEIAALSVPRPHRDSQEIPSEMTIASPPTAP